MNDSPEYKKRRLKFLKEHKCQVMGCYNFRYTGYIYCVGHIHEFPKRMVDEDIELLMESEYEKRNSTS